MIIVEICLNFEQCPAEIMTKIKSAVIGVGYLGKFHAQKYSVLPDAELVAVCDTDPKICEDIAKKYTVEAVTDYHALLDKVDAVSIAVPTRQHYEVARAFLDKGIHVLIEKPITHTVAEARKLIEIANKNHLVFQVGHLERFNAARLALEKFLDSPCFIESHRIAPFNLRGIDVNVILDLMIHDIDIIQSIIKSPIKNISAHGSPILSDSIDIANVRIEFANACVANVTASRVSFKTERKTRIFQTDSYISVDFQHKEIHVFHKDKGEMMPGIPKIAHQEFIYKDNDALQLEIEAFLQAIIKNTKPVVTGDDGCRALETAETITTLINENLARFNALHSK